MGNFHEIMGEIINQKSLNWQLHYTLVSLSIIVLVACARRKSGVEIEKTFSQ